MDMKIFALPIGQRRKLLLQKKIKNKLGKVKGDIEKKICVNDIL